MPHRVPDQVPLPSRPPFRIIGPEPPPVSERPDETLMLDHGAGSEPAFEELVRRHQKPVLNYIYRMVRNRQVAEELTQEVFLALVKNAQRYRPTARFTTYLYKIASNIVSKEWARSKRRPRLLALWAPWARNTNDADDFNPLEHLPDTRQSVEASFARQEVSEAVNTALNQLPPHQRQAFVLHRFQQLSYEEVASITNTPVGTVKSRVVRAERALRPLLAPFREYI